MTVSKLKNALTHGETMTVEFQRCESELIPHVYETICAFLNRNGGDIYLGVDDDGTVFGVPEDAIPDILNDFNEVMNDEDLIFPL
jgi:ATP-dependent DNA helicase RecG